MKLVGLISKNKERSSRRLFRHAFGLTLVLLLLAGYGEAPPGQQGEIIGITAQISLRDAQEGDIKNIAYVGTIVVLLSDSEEVIAHCNEEFLSDMKGAPAFNVDQVSGAFVVTITINLKEHQNVLLVRDEADEWKVTRVLK